jgi:hypothetical protein
MSGFLVAPVLARVITTLGIIWKLKRDAEVCGRMRHVRFVPDSDSCTAANNYDYSITSATPANRKCGIVISLN